MEGPRRSVRRHADAANLTLSSGAGLVCTTGEPLPAVGYYSYYKCAPRGIETVAAVLSIGYLCFLCVLCPFLP